MFVRSKKLGVVRRETKGALNEHRKKFEDYTNETEERQADSNLGEI